MDAQTESVKHTVSILLHGRGWGEWTLLCGELSLEQLHAYREMGDAAEVWDDARAQFISFDAWMAQCNAAHEVSKPEARLVAVA